MRIGLSSSSSNGEAKIGGLDKVTGGGSSSGSNGIFSSILSLFGIGSGASSRPVASTDEDDEQEENSEELDYVDWNVLQSQAGGNESGMAAASTNFSLEKLDEDVVLDGKADCALSSLSEIGDWVSEKISGEEEILELKKWLIHLVE